LWADYVTVIEDWPIMSTKYCLSVIFCQNWPMQQSRTVSLWQLSFLLLFLSSF